jgi:uncharacterized coiled-coil protein SlyX
LQKNVIVFDGLKNQEKHFRNQCKEDLTTLNSIIEKLQDKKFKEEIDNLDECEIQKQIIRQLNLQLAKKNRAIATYARQLDDIPERFELTQYQRRFMELYNQGTLRYNLFKVNRNFFLNILHNITIKFYYISVSIKHKETKQYYSLYNTLDDKKLYLSKELSLLNSIQDNYNE